METDALASHVKGARKHAGSTARSSGNRDLGVLMAVVMARRKTTRAPAREVKFKRQGVAAPHTARATAAPCKSAV